MTAPHGERGTTFIFADTAGSAGLWENDPESVRPALSRYHSILGDAITTAGGRIFKTIGDTVCATFPDAANALAAAMAAQRAMHAASWSLSPPPHLRVAIHRGAAIERGGDYFGPPVNQVARLLHAANGGQTLITAAAMGGLAGPLPADVACRDLGRHTLRDVQEPVHVYQADPAELARDFPPLATQEYDPNNLPAQMTSFVGREAERADLHAILAQPLTRLVTLTGPGGVGKTRLAVQVALESRDRFPDGRYLVQLAPLDDPALVARAIAEVIDVREAGGEALLPVLTNAIGTRRLLLLLDNFEQVSDAAPLVSHLLVACPRLTVIVTSRVRLRLTGEQEYEVPPLTMPVHAGTPVDELERIAAVQLFVNRARATRPQFALTAANAPALASICRKLDGLPLAIELAAARSKRIPPERILDQLDDRFGFLTQGSRDLPPRQQALRSAIDWSYDLLSPEHQQLFQRLGVFVGGFTLEAAEEVVNAPGGGTDTAFFDVLDGVSTLVDNSLLQVGTAPNGDPRYGMLQTIHEYARERLIAGGERQALSRRHVAWVQRLAVESRMHWRTPEEAGWLGRLEAEVDNVRAALAWLATDGTASAHLTLAAALWWFWVNGGYLREGRAQLEAALARPGDDAPAARADALTGIATICHLEGDWSAASDYFAQALPLIRLHGDARGLVRALNNAGNVALVRDDLPAAAALYQEALEHLRVSDDQTVLGIVLSNLGRIARHQGNHALSRTRFREALAVQTAIGEVKGRITTTANLADLLLDLGETDEAERLFREVRDGYETLGDRHSTGYALERLAQLAILRDDWPAAQADIDEATAIFDQVGDEDGIADTHMALAELRQAQGQPREAAALLARALDIWQTREVDASLVPACIKLATIACAAGEGEPAARVLGAIETLRRRAHGVISPRAERELAQASAAARRALGGRAFDAAFAAGQCLPAAAIIAEARAIAAR